MKRWDSTGFYMKQVKWELIELWLKRWIYLSVSQEFTNEH